MKHTHHIIPRHMGGTDDPSNLVELTIEEHAEAHRKLYEKYGHKEDKLAWLGLAKIVDRQQIIKEVQTLGGLKGNKVRTERYHNDPEWAADVRRKQSKPKTTTINMFGPKGDDHKKNISKTALKRPRIKCVKCGNGYTKQNYDKHVRACNECI